MNKLKVRDGSYDKPSNVHTIFQDDNQILVIILISAATQDFTDSIKRENKSENSFC